MAEYIISADRLESVQKQAWHAGHSNVEPCKLSASDGEEIIRCRDCGFYTPETIKFMDGTYGSDIEVVPFCDKLRRETNPNGFCSWAERRQ